jgi:hypothetical protein
MVNSNVHLPDHFRNTEKINVKSSKVEWQHLFKNIHLNATNIPYHIFEPENPMLHDYSINICP